MRLFFIPAVFVIGAALFTATANAACGGGGFTPMATASVQTDTRHESRSYSGEYRQDNRSPSRGIPENFDSQFLRSINRLNLTHEQYTSAMKASREVHAKLEDRSQRNFEAKHELETKLAEILTPEQMAKYQAAY